MASAAASIPDENALICERCGYTLTGLPDGSACPECGTPLADSDPSHRLLSPWERSNGSLSGFVRTTWDILLHPARFYRGLSTGARDRKMGSAGKWGNGAGSLGVDQIQAARAFASRHWAIAATLFGTAAAVHESWYWDYIGGAPRGWRVAFWPMLIILTFALLAGTTRLAARLTAWEAAYRGLRMPHAAVLRALYFHAAQYPPVALGALVTVLGYQVLLAAERIGPDSATTYLYILCAEVVIGAAWLFHTYWIGMRNIMYANG